MVYATSHQQCIIVILLSSALGQNLFSKLDSVMHQELNKTTRELENLTTKSPAPVKPFLPFSDLGAPAGPSKIGKEQHQVPKGFLNLIPKGIYTTLDKLPRKKVQINLKKLIGENLGGLSPEEVYYMDKDLLIIKGGDFDGKKYVKKYGRRRKDFKRSRRIKTKTHQTSLGLKFNATNNSDKRSVEENSSSILPVSSISTTDLSLFLPSLQVQSRKKKQASAYHYLFMPAPMSVLRDNFYAPPGYINYLYNNYHHSNPFQFHSHLNYQDDYIYLPHFHGNNAAIYKNWLPAPLKVAHSYFGDTDVNYKLPRQHPNPDAEWSALKSNLK